MENYYSKRYFLDPETGRPIRVATNHEPDDGGFNPREDYEHFTILRTWDSDYISPDGDVSMPGLDSALYQWADSGRHGGDVDAALVKRFASIFLANDVLYVGALSRSYDGQLTVNSDPEAGDRYDGIAVVLRSQWEAAMGADYTGTITPEKLVQGEISEYSNWAVGNIWSYVVHKADDNDPDIEFGEEFERIGGMIADNDDYAMQEGVCAVLGEHTVNGGEGWQESYELDEADFEDALEAWVKEHGHKATGTGWPK